MCLNLQKQNMPNFLNYILKVLKKHFFDTNILNLKIKLLLNQIKLYMTIYHMDVPFSTSKLETRKE